MELVRQPHPKLCLLSVWLDEGMWLGINFNKGAQDYRWQDRMRDKLKAQCWHEFTVAEIEDAVADESCARWHELVAALSEQDREVLGRCAE